VIDHHKGVLEVPPTLNVALAVEETAVSFAAGVVPMFAVDRCENSLGVQETNIDVSDKTPLTPLGELKVL